MLKSERRCCRSQRSVSLRIAVLVATAAGLAAAAEPTADVAEMLRVAELDRDRLRPRVSFELRLGEWTYEYRRDQDDLMPGSIGWHPRTAYVNGGLKELFADAESRVRHLRVAASPAANARPAYELVTPEEAAMLLPRCAAAEAIRLPLYPDGSVDAFRDEVPEERNLLRAAVDAGPGREQDALLRAGLGFRPFSHRYAMWTNPGPDYRARRDAVIEAAGRVIRERPGLGVVPDDLRPLDRLRAKKQASRRAELADRCLAEAAAPFVQAMDNLPDAADRLDALEIACHLQPLFVRVLADRVGPLPTYGNSRIRLRLLRDAVRDLTPPPLQAVGPEVGVRVETVAGTPTRVLMDGFGERLLVATEDARWLLVDVRSNRQVAERSLPKGKFHRYPTRAALRWPDALHGVVLRGEGQVDLVSLRDLSVRPLTTLTPVADEIAASGGLLFAVDRHAVRVYESPDRVETFDLPRHAAFRNVPVECGTDAEGNVCVVLRGGSVLYDRTTRRVVWRSGVRPDQVRRQMVTGSPGRPVLVPMDGRSPIVFVAGGNVGGASPDGRRRLVRYGETLAIAGERSRILHALPGSFDGGDWLSDEALLLGNVTRMAHVRLGDRLDVRPVPFPAPEMEAVLSASEDGRIWAYVTKRGAVAIMSLGPRSAAP